MNQPAAGVATSGAITTNQAAGTTTQTNPAVADTTANANGAVEEGKADTATTAAPERRSILRKRSNVSSSLKCEMQPCKILIPYFIHRRNCGSLAVTEKKMKKK